MSWRLVVRRRARLDFIEASDWYEEQVPGRGIDFLRTLEAPLHKLRDNPLQYQQFRGELRRVVLRPYPYSLIYIVERDEIIVLRCVHGRRGPRRWLPGR